MHRSMRPVGHRASRTSAATSASRPVSRRGRVHRSWPARRSDAQRSLYPAQLVQPGLHASVFRVLLEVSAVHVDCCRSVLYDDVGLCEIGLSAGRIWVKLGIDFGYTNGFVSKSPSEGEAIGDALQEVAVVEKDVVRAG